MTHAASEPRVTGLGHVGIAARDLDTLASFYTDVLGLTVTDRTERIVFMSAQPESEHHEFVLSIAPDRHPNPQQISFTVDSLDELRELYRTVRDHPNCSDMRVVSHGIAIGCYFRDPENNRVEMYWSTGMDYVQPVGEPVDLEASNEQILSQIEAMSPRESETPRFYGADKGKRIAVGVTAA
jgi:catechol-2,3-dioxygenase